MCEVKAPKCPSHLLKGEVVQTYHIAGQPKYKCLDDGLIFEQKNFDDIDFKWDIDPVGWRKHHKLKGKGPVKDKDRRRSVVA